MAETDKYIITDMKKNRKLAPWTKPPAPGEYTTLLYLDNEVVEGAFYTECAWFWPRTPEELATDFDTTAHKHDFNEVLAVFGTDPDNINDLGGEMEIWLNGEQHNVTKSCLVFIPAGMEHGPVHFTRIDRPIFHFAVHTGGMYF